MQDTGNPAAQPPRALDQEFYQDPHALYERLREEGPARPVIMLARFPGLRLDADPATLRWHHGVLMHGLHSLPVRTAAGAA